MNLEILKQHTINLRVQDKTIFCVNGQQAIDHVVRVVKDAIAGLDQS